MKQLAVLLSLLLVMLCLTGCISKQGQNAPDGADTRPAQTEGPKDPTTEEPATDASLTEVPVTAPDEKPEGEYLEDFTVKTIDGANFTLSEALKDHELVLINLWATWCGPCGMEFPYLQEAWTQCADRVAVIALSLEPTDTEDTLREYAERNGLSFPIGRADGTDLDRFVTVGIPTTLLVDRNMRVVAVEIGAKSSTAEFLEFFDSYSGSNYDPRVSTYTVYVYDYNYQGVEGVVVNFCTDLTCTPVTSDAEGTAVFTGAPDRYHVQVIGIPEGMELLSDAEWYTEPYSQTFLVELR